MQHERDADDNNNNDMYGDVFDTSNVHIDNDYSYTPSINNYQPRNYQIYFDDECTDLSEKPKPSPNHYDSVSNATESSRRFVYKSRCER